MPTKLTVVKADLSVETGYISPAFGLFRDIPALLQHLFARLQSHVPRLQEMKVERGTENSFGEFHVACHLYGLRLGVRVYAEKVSIVFINVLENEVEKFGSVVVDALSAVKEHQPTLAFQTHTMAVVLHGTLEGKSVREYLSSFVRNVPNGLGPHTGSGGVMYFGAEDDRILSTMTVDLSGMVPDGLFVRPYVVWDAKKVEVAALPVRATGFIRQALGAFGLEISSLRLP